MRGIAKRVLKCSKASLRDIRDQMQTRQLAIRQSVNLVHPDLEAICDLLEEACETADAANDIKEFLQNLKDSLENPEPTPTEE